MSLTPVESYLQRVLNPQLLHCGLDNRQQALVAEDVGRRLTSLLARWRDFPFRRTALLWGVEEATFYEPAAAALEVRALVVAAVRNSLIEDLASSRPATPALQWDRPRLTESELAALTRAAVEHFQTTDLARCQIPPPATPDQDVFGFLERSYPNAWGVLSHLANAPGPEVTYAPRNQPAPELPGASSSEGQFPSVWSVVLSGMDPEFDPGLAAYLKQIKEGRVPFFFADSFKGITRNPRKLFHVIEYVLGHGAAVVTHNYYLSPSCAARRQPLLRPFHRTPEVIAKLANQAGLSARHQAAIAFIKSNI